MAFLASLLPALGGLFPGIVSTVGKVIGKIGQGDFSGALGEVGNALSGGGGQAVAKAVEQTASNYAEREKIEREQAAIRAAEARAQEGLVNPSRARYSNGLEYETIARQMNNRARAEHLMPVWHGRGTPRYASNARAAEVYVPEEEEEIEERFVAPVPPPRKNKRRNRRA